MANNVDPDQTAPLEQSDLSLHCLSDLSVPILIVLLAKDLLMVKNQLFICWYSLIHCYYHYYYTILITILAGVRSLILHWLQ